MPGIDLDRGVMMKEHAATGVKIFMYIDTPGVYLNAHGGEVDEQMAVLAGFEVDKHRKELLKKTKLAEAMSKIEAELQIADDGAERKVLHKFADFTVVEMGLGRAHVADADGGYITPVPVPVQEAAMLAKAMAGDDVEDEIEAEGAKGEEKPVLEVKGGAKDPVSKTSKGK